MILRKGGREEGRQEGARIDILYIKNTITEISSTEKFKGKVKEELLKQMKPTRKFNIHPSRVLEKTKKEERNDQR